MKKRAEILIEEIRSARNMVFRTYQWGITIMLATTAGTLYTVRKDILNRLVEQGSLSYGESLPFYRYLIGTFFLLFLACLFAFFTMCALRPLQIYKKQLNKADNSGIEWPSKTFGSFGVWIYFLFPLVDILVRIYVRIEFKI